LYILLFKHNKKKTYQPQRL